mmetsp:Transcript_9832/g.20435  ORF Transcript_9832/g.20435 Transcript_9832/m.20435 type:complete len:121 (-) Transcript_9832:477-839(-)
MISLRMLFPTLLVLLFSVHRIESFQIGPHAVQTVKPTVPISSNQHYFDLSTTPSVSRSSTEIAAKKGEEEPEREKKNALELVILYMTPWRNPNSIFVYLFGGLYFLGKYSEAQLAAGNPL